MQVLLVFFKVVTRCTHLTVTRVGQLTNMNKLTTWDLC